MSSYLEALRQAAILFPVLAVLFTVPYIAFNYHKYGSVLSVRILVVYSFVLYLLCVYCLVILPLPSSEAAAALHGHKAQLIPFAFVGDILRTSHVVWNRPETWVSLFTCGAFLTTAFNLLMTMPFGMYLRYYFRCGWKKTLVMSALLSLFFELTQLTGLYFIYPGSYRIFDVDDLMVNTCGSMIGYLIAGLAARVLPTREKMDRASFARGRRVSFLRRLVALLYDGVVLALAAVMANLAAAAFHWRVQLPEPAVQALCLAYFAFCPVLLGGSTVGHRLTRLKLVTAAGRPPRWYQYLLRYGLLLAAVRWSLPALRCLLDALEAWGLVTELAGLLLGGAAVVGYLVFLFLALARVMGGRPAFYERWSGTGLVSTVTEAEQPSGT